ncbi:partner of numb [Cochliomyia hominivorax]
MATLNSISHNTDYDLTPSRKRKRQFEKLEQKEQEKAIKVTAAATTSCFTNAAFSSTPKKIVGKRRLQVNTNKENTTDFPNVGLEVKSISEIAKHREEKQNIPQNPYEVLRKPPKKKKRHTEETACFENPALNLELPEKQFNPYEVKRDITPHKNSNCFSNPALNLKIQDASAIRNPFEVQRETLAEKNVTEPALLNPFEIPIENEKQAVVTTPKPCKLKLGLPFVPTVGCRIDFKDISMSQLTPSKLLAEKLVFSPVVKPKVSLGSIGEETTMDIGKELDRYQLELENSINEAKLRKNGIVDEEIPLTPPDSNFQIQIVDIEKKSKFTQKLCGISEDGETEEVIEEITQQTEEHHTEMRLKKEENNEQKGEIISDNNPFLYDINTQLQRTETAEVIEIENLDDLYGCSADDQVDEDSFDFKTPAPFVRAYTKPVEAIQNLKVSKESLTSNKTDKSDEMEDQGKKHLNVKNIIRKSIRKLMHPHQHDEQHSASNEKDLLDKPEHEKHNGLMNAIRQSLRRKPSKNLTDEGTATKECEISIIDTTERTMKLKSDALQTEYVKIEDLTNEKKHNLRNSIRKSTRDVRNQILKSVFHKKHEEYDFKK